MANNTESYVANVQQQLASLSPEVQRRFLRQAGVLGDNGSVLAVALLTVHNVETHLPATTPNRDGIRRERVTNMLTTWGVLQSEGENVASADDFIKYYLSPEGQAFVSERRGRDTDESRYRGL